MFVELLEILCGSTRCEGAFSESPCFFLACGIFIKFFSILILGLGDTTQPKVKESTSPFLVLIKYCGCIEIFASLVPFFFNLQNDNLAFVSVVDSALSAFFFWVIFDYFKSCSLCRWKFSLIACNICILFGLLGYISFSKMKEYAALSLHEQSNYISYIIRELSFLFIAGGLIITVVHDPLHQLPQLIEESMTQESSVLRISLLGMKKSYVTVDNDDSNDEDNNEDHDVASNTKANAMLQHKPQNYYNLLFFSWMTPVFKVAKKRPLTMNDVPPLPQERSCSHNSKRFFIELIHQNMNVLQAIKKLYLHEYLFTGVLIFIKSLASFAGPIMLDKLVRAASALADENDEESDSDARARQWAIVYIDVAILFLSKVVSAFAVSHYNYSCQRISISVSAAIKGSLYQKTLLLSSQSRQAHTMGSITNLYTVDADRVVNVTVALHNFWALPLQILIAMLLLYFVVSWAMLAGFGAITLVLLFNKIIATKTKTITDRLMAFKDSRMKSISEIFKSLLTIKLNSWEAKFRSKVLDSRDLELQLLWVLLVLYALNIFLLWMAPNVVAVATIAVYTKALGEDITTARVFTALALFRLLQSPLRALPDYITQYYQAVVSLERLEKYFNMDEKDGICVDLMRNDTGLYDIVGLETKSRKVGLVMVGEIILENCIYQWKQDGSDMREEEFKSMKNETESSLLHVSEDGENKLLKLNISDLKIRPTNLVVVKGPVGSGKSSFCYALLGEMPPCSIRHDEDIQPLFRICGRIAFAGQQPWIQTGSLRENILFGLPYDKIKYDRVVDACCLIQDFAELPDGDLTFIGQKGINLSGGQKSRTALARAVYADADIYILDDVFAALDAIVGKQVFEKVVLNLLQGKTRIIVTHKEDIIKHAAVSHTLEISPEGDLVATQHLNLGLDVDLSSANDETKDNVVYSISAVPYIDNLSASLTPVGSDDGNAYEDVDDDDKLCMDYSYSGKQVGTKKQGLDVDEDTGSGGIDTSVFKGYLSAAGGMKAIAAILCIQTTWQLLSIASDVFITEWAKESDDEQKRNIDKNIAIYASLALGSGFLVLARTMAISTMGFAAAKKMFESMLDSLLFAPMWWHDRNPTGRILNRFSDDQDKVDNTVAVSVGSVLATGFSTAGRLVTILVITRYLGLIIVPLAFIYFRLMQTYLLVGREVQRLQSTSKSPFLSLMSETVDGLAQLRSFGIDAIRRCILRNELMVDEFCRATFAISSGNAWFTLRIQLLSAYFVLAICGILFAGVFSAHSFISPSLLALALSYSLYISDDVMALVMIWSWFEQSMVCPERILQYINVPSEGTHSQLALFREDHNDGDDGVSDVEGILELKNTNVKTSADSGTELSDKRVNDTGVNVARESWPLSGVIEFRHVWFRYQPIEDVFEKLKAINSRGDDIGTGCVLRNLHFKTTSAEKIGIVGRTGAGKSSLTMCLFRISEIARGKVFIDGKDISQLSLPCLRSAIEIVPQNPVVFKGTLRNYIDPFEEYNDTQIWSALRKAKLVSMVEKMGSSVSSGLDVEIAENGDNMSVGQRQMLVMSRALLREAKILVMDEATAAMDIESDQLLQEVLRDEFKNTTVLTIAHRIETIIDCDRVIVMAEGTMIEFDRPDVLIRRRESVFHKLASDAGIDIGNFKDNDNQ